MQKHCIKSSSKTCFGHLLESPQRGDSNKYPKHMFYEEIIRIKQDFLPLILSIIDSLQQQIHYNGNVFGNKCCRCKEDSLITKTYLYNFDPLKPHFYIVKLGFTGVYIIFLISAQNIDCGYSLEPPRRGGSNEYPQSMF